MGDGDGDLSVLPNALSKSIERLKAESSGMRAELEASKLETRKLLGDVGELQDIYADLKGTLEDKRAMAVSQTSRAEDAERLAAATRQRAEEAERKLIELQAQLDAAAAQAIALKAEGEVSKEEADMQRSRAELAEEAAEECRKWAMAAETTLQAEARHIDIAHDADRAHREHTMRQQTMRQDALGAF